ncbi:MAG: AAA family ATPase [Archangiaceae bacterium]|nr:AAA family ATPase [Archangiaceae bacterium]
MITQVSIKGLRGVAEGMVGGLTPLTILTGVNGSGKSTVLDALLIGTVISGGGALVQVVQRRTSRQFTGEWLFRRKAGQASVEIFTTNRSRHTVLDWLSVDDARTHLPGPNGGSAKLHGGVRASFASLGQRKFSAAVFFANGEVLTHSNYAPEEIPQEERFNAKLIDMRGAAGEQRDLTEVLTDAKAAGAGAATVELLAKVAPGVLNLEILRVGSGYEVGLIYGDGAVPLSMAGDGIRAVARLALELAALPNGLALLEEPEVHQHPGALKQSAATMVTSVKRGLQVVVATHSLELIDELLLAAKKSEILDQLTVQNLRLVGGVLSSTRFEGPESDEIRNVIGTELR